MYSHTNQAADSRVVTALNDRGEGVLPLTSSLFSPPPSHHYRRRRRRRRTISDVLDAPTDDQLDIGSGMEGRHGEDNAQTVRRRYNDGPAASSSVGGPAPVGGASSAVAGTTMTFDKVLKVRARECLP